MGNNIKHYILTLLFVSASICGCFGQTNIVPDSSEEEIFKLSLAELMNIKVDVVSKVNELVNEAPGVVSVITAREIESFGASSLRDVLERVTGVVGLTGFTPSNVISVRGDKPQTSNKHVLILINGRPTRESITSGEDGEVYGMFPINCIEQIEVIRGPGSVLYGTNAYTGVINIVTKHTKEYFSANVSGGLPNSTIASVSGGAKIGKGVLSAGVYYKNLREWEQSFITESGIDTSFNTHEKGLGATLSYFSGGFAATSSLISWNNFLIGPDLGGNYANATRHFIDVGYTHQFTKKIRTSINATNTYYFQDGTPIHPRRTSNDLLTELTFYVTPNKKLNIIAGGLLNNVSGIIKKLINDEIIPTMPYYNQLHCSFYSQADYKLLSSLKIIVGFQLHKYNKSLPAKFVPRLGLIWNPKEKITVKALYAEAYRAPSAGETTVNESKRVGNPDLKPEIVNSFELEIGYSDKKIQPSITMFMYKQLDNINLDESVVPQKFINNGTFSAQGVEFEMKYIPVENLFITGSCTYQTNLLDNNIKNSTTAPITAKLGVSYALDFGLSFGLFNIFNSTPPDVVLRYPTRKIVNPVPAAFNLFSANIDYNLSKDLLKSRTDIILNLRAENLLNEEIYTPEWVRSRINSIPGKPGRRIFFGVKINI
jgi:outer membrane receptor for ferrienterochelin and colicins